MKRIAPETLNRYREVLELRTAGLSFDEIAKRTGYAGRQGAQQAYTRAMERWAIESVEEQRIIQSMRLDAIFTQAYLAARQGDLQAIDRCLRIEKRRAELWGLDAPKQHEVTGRDGAPLETDVGALLKQRLDEIAERNQHALEAGIGDGSLGD